MLVRQVLADKEGRVVTTSPDAKLSDVVVLMNEKRIGAVIVLDADANLAGIVSERDINRGLAVHGVDLLTMRVDEVMTADVVTCTPDDSTDNLMRKMTAGRFRHLPVIDKGRLVGIVSIGDVVKHRLEELEAESSMLQDYIAGAA